MNERKIEKRLKSYVQSMVMSQSKDELIKKAMKYLEFVYKQRTIDLELYILFGKKKNKMSKYKHYTILAEIACEKGTSFSEVKKEFVQRLQPSHISLSI